MTETLKFEQMTPGDWERVAGSLSDGGLACLPADTVYGLACVPSPKAMGKIYEAKGREPLRPLALVFLSVAQICSTVPDLPEVIREALLRLMPGPVTCVLPLARPLLGINADRQDSVGVRVIPPPMGNLYEILPSPLAVTSANLSGGPDPCGVQAIPAAIAAASDFVIDAGPCEHCMPSTVVDLRPLIAGRAPLILREGVWAKRKIRHILGPQ